VICDRIAILDQGELICMGRLDDLLGTANQYVVKGRGGCLSALDAWLDRLTIQGDSWRGHVKGDPYEFVSHIPSLGGQIITLQQARPTLEEFFMAKIEQRR
jgi:ABC-2 type transport system ATP-binding protein